MDKKIRQIYDYIEEHHSNKYHVNKMKKKFVVAAIWRVLIMICAGSLLCGVVLGVLFSLSIIFLRKRELVALHFSRDMRFPTMWYVRPAKLQISLRICAV